MEKLEQVGATSEGHKESQSEAKTGKTAKLKEEKTLQNWRNCPDFRESSNN